MHIQHLDIGIVSVTSAVQHKYCSAAIEKGDAQMSRSISQAQSGPQGILDDVRLQIERLWSAIKQANGRRISYNRTISELSSLSDRELSDLGIPRSHIRRIALEETSKGQKL